MQRQIDEETGNLYLRVPAPVGMLDNPAGWAQHAQALCHQYQAQAVTRNVGQFNKVTLWWCAPANTGAPEDAGVRSVPFDYYSNVSQEWLALT